MKKAVVTGATSSIGASAVKALIADGYQVLAVVRPKTARLARLPDVAGLTVVECDVANVHNFPEQAEKYDVFYHLAWEHTGKDERLDLGLQNLNVAHTLTALQLAKRLGCRRFIGAGSQAEYGLKNHKLMENEPVAPVMAYGWAKYAAGELILQIAPLLDMSAAWVRIFSVYGINDTQNTLINYVIQTLAKKGSPTLSDCTQIWDYLYDADAGAALVALAKTDASGIFNLGSGKGRILKDYVEEIRAIMGAKAAISYGAISKRADQPEHLEADITKITAATGWQPKWNFADGIGEILDHYRRNNLLGRE